MKVQGVVASVFCLMLVVGIGYPNYVLAQNKASLISLEADSEESDSKTKEMTLEGLDEEYEKLKLDLEEKYKAARERLKSGNNEAEPPLPDSQIPVYIAESKVGLSAAAPVDSDNGDVKMLDEVFISASKEEETLKDIPGGVGIIKKETIDRTTSQGLHEVLKFIPGVTVQNRFGTDDVNISIRGSGIRQSFGVRGIQVLVDGIPLTEPDGQTRLDLIDMQAIERIEVVKGPATTVYGGNASGGVINLITKKGKPNSGFNAETKFWAGSYGYAKGYGSIYGGEGNHTYHASFSHFQKDGYRAHAATDGQKVNVSSEWQLDEKSRLQLLLSAGTVNILIPGSLTMSQMINNPKQPQGLALQRDSNRFDDRFRLGILYQKQLSTYLQATATGYWDWRQLEHVPTFIFLEISRIGSGGDLRFLYNRPVFGFANKLIFGSSYQYQSQKENDYTPLPGNVRGMLLADEDQFASHFGAYIQDQFFITKDLSVTAGIRYSNIVYDLDDHFTAPLPGQSGDEDYERFNPRIGINWSPIKDIMIFANHSTAFQTPTLSEVTSGLSGGFNGLQPERVKNYEIGSRGNFSLFGMKSAYEITYFRMDFDNKILASRTGFVTTFRNAGSTNHEGVELGLGVDVTRSLNAQLTYTYSDFKFTSGQFNGNYVPGQSPHQIVAALYYKFFLKGKAKLTTGVEYRYSDSFAVNDLNDSINPNWYTLALKMNYENKKFGASLVVDNLTDVTYSDAVSINSSLGNFYNPADGLTVTGSVSWKF